MTKEKQHALCTESNLLQIMGEIKTFELLCGRQYYVKLSPNLWLCQWFEGIADRFPVETRHVSVLLNVQAGAVVYPT